MKAWTTGCRSTEGRRRWIVGTLLSAVLASAAFAATRDESHEVRDPHYGEALFDFYQQKYFSAITDLTVAQHFHRLKYHDQDGELLLGGLYLSYGLHREAGEIFTRLIEQGARPDVRDRAWFYLAKIRYQRGYTDEALEAVSRIHGKLPGDLEAERRVLYAYLLMAKERYGEAVAVLRDLDASGDWAAYGRYNLGVALIKAGEKVEGVALLEQVGSSKVKTEEMKALRDKANVALGFASIQDNAPWQAQRYLERVRLRGLMSNKALLGMGWAHSESEDYRKALAVWLELRHRDAADSAIQESLLAIPYAYGKLAAHRQALDNYEYAVAAYTREITRLDDAIADIRAGKLVDTLLQEDQSGEAGWLWRLEKLPDTPESHYLLRLLASHDFQEALKNYRDLRFLRSNLNEWAQNTAIYGDMIATRRQRFASLLPKVKGEQQARSIAGFEAQRDGFAADIARIEQTGDAKALASAQEQDWIARLHRIEQSLARLGASPEATAIRDKYRILAGIVEFDLSSTFVPRLWESQKGMKELDEAIEEAKRRNAALAQAYLQAPKAFEGFEQRVVDLRGRITALQRSVADVAKAQEQHLANLAIDELKQQQERLYAYITQAKFAVAQIYDEAVRAQESAQP